MGFSWRKTFKTKQTRKPKCLSAFDVEHAQCLTGYHVFMVSGLDLARAPRRARLTARKKGSGYENETVIIIIIIIILIKIRINYIARHQYSNIYTRTWLA